MLLGVAVFVFAVIVLGACSFFPNTYAKEIENTADEFGLPTELVKAVVWTESKYNKFSVSNRGAIGLMQLMPQTLDECALAIDGNGDGFDVVNNLRCGCYYLSLMLKRFDGNVDHALMAYNAGENNARQFLNGKEVFEETKKYVRTVKRVWAYYRVFV